MGMNNIDCILETHVIDLVIYHHVVYVLLHGQQSNLMLFNIMQCLVTQKLHVYFSINDSSTPQKLFKLVAECI